MSNATAKTHAGLRYLRSAMWTGVTVSFLLIGLAAAGYA